MRDVVDVVGALPPTGTFVTNYSIYPFVGLTEPGGAFRPNPSRSTSRPAITARPACRLRAEAPDPPRRADPDRHVHRRRPPDLGRDGEDPGRTARAPEAAAVATRPSPPARRPCSPTRSTSRRSSSRRRFRAARQHEPRVGRALADAAIGHDVVAVQHALALVQLWVGRGLERAVLVTACAHGTLSRRGCARSAARPPARSRPSRSARRRTPGASARRRAGARADQSEHLVALRTDRVVGRLR